MADTPPPRRTIIYIDGFNLYFRALKPLNKQWLNLQLYFSRLRKDDNLRRIYYFTAPVSGASKAGHEAYLAALAANCPLVTTISGKHQTQYLECEVAGCSYAGDRRYFKFKEKRTDVNIAIQMVHDAHSNECDRMVLVTGDSDLIPAVNLVQKIGKLVFLYVPFDREDDYDAASELRKSAHFSRTLPIKMYNTTQFPNDIPDGKGGTFTKSPDW